MSNNNKNLGKIIKQRRLAVELTLHQLSVESGVSSSHLGRIEKGQRFPSARILRRLAKPLGLEESALFMFAGYLSPSPIDTEEGHRRNGWDPYVTSVLAQEPVEVQRATIVILGVLKTLAKKLENIR
ncbi:MAG: XRE family transcriptional regulator [Dehalococcoidia bacterium]|nr:MAG: XRE family transcriptional regulator [Dehalococcoidia bacterium]